MTHELKRRIYNTVIEANRKIPPRELENSVIRVTGVHRKAVKCAINALVAAGDLSYTYLYGTSFLEPSFDRPVRVSQSIVIKPPQKTYEPYPGEVVINIAPGAAFGNGAHPTTRLALRALDATLSDLRNKKGETPSTGLDVGTGTGILAIALAVLGIGKVMGIDMDPCALFEATNNVLLNGLEKRVTISNTPLESCATTYSIIVANLAYPTLRRLPTALWEKMKPGGVLVLSGFKETASKDLENVHTEQGFRLIHEATEREWACSVLRKPRPDVT